MDRAEKTWVIIKEIKELLKHGSLSTRQIYDMLIANHVLPINSLSRFKHVLTDALRDGIIDKKLIVRPKKREKKPNVFKREEIIKLFDTIDNPKIMMACFIAYYCGLRIGEVCNLKANDVDLENQRLKVVDGKGGKDGYVMFPKKIVTVLEKWMQLKQDEVFFIPSRKTKEEGIRAKSLTEQLHKYMTRCGIKKIEGYFKTRDGKVKPIPNYSFHTFRHTRATHFLERGWDIRYIQQFLRHENIQTTQIYTHVSNSQIKSLIDNDEAYKGNLMHAQGNFNVPQNPLEALQLRLIRQEIDVYTYRQLRSELERNITKLEEDPNLYPLASHTSR